MSSSSPPSGPVAQPDSEHLRQLIEAMAGGDQEALRSLVQCSAPWLYPVARRLAGGDVDAASGLCEHLFVEVWRLSPCYDRNFGPPMAWMLLLLREEAGVANRASSWGGSLDSSSLERLWFAEPGGADGA